MEIIINGNTVSGTAQELAQLIALVDTATESAVKEADKVAKPKPKREKPAMTKSEAAMANRAIAALGKLGFECKSRKQGTWLWVYPTNGKGRSEGFRAAKLAKGWKHSPKRGAFYRVMD